LLKIFGNNDWTARPISWIFFCFHFLFKALLKLKFCFVPLEDLNFNQCFSTKLWNINVYQTSSQVLYFLNLISSLKILQFFSSCNKHKNISVETKVTSKWEKVRTTNFTTSKTKKNIKKVGDDHYIEKIYKSDQNIEIQKDQNIESDLPMAFCLLNLT
jgi:hypothetical protein